MSSGTKLVTRDSKMRLSGRFCVSPKKIEGLNLEQWIKQRDRNQPANRLHRFY